MGDSIKSIRDDYDDYLAVCQVTATPPIALFDGSSRYKFYEHLDEILEKFECKNIYSLYEKLIIKSDEDKSKFKAFYDNNYTN